MEKESLRNRKWKNPTLSGLALVYFLLFLVNPSLSQEKENGEDITINGRVSGSDGEPLIGAAITVEGTDTGTVSDPEGKYEISVTQGSTLIFSYVGFESEKRVVEEQDTVDVTLTEEVAALDEVVVIGYGTQRRSDLTGAVSQVSSREINSFP